MHSTPNDSYVVDAPLYRVVRVSPSLCRISFSTPIRSCTMCWISMISLVFASKHVTVPSMACRRELQRPSIEIVNGSPVLRKAHALSRTSLRTLDTQKLVQMEPVENYPSGVLPPSGNFHLLSISLEKFPLPHYWRNGTENGEESSWGTGGSSSGTATAWGQMRRAA